MWWLKKSAKNHSERHREPEQDSRHDVRLEMLNSFLTSPRGRLDRLGPLHDDLMARDPVFYGHLAAWYRHNGSLRDHDEVLMATLLTSRLPEHREAGFVLLQELPPYQVWRVVDYIKRRRGGVPRSTRTAVVHYLRRREADPRLFDRAAIRARKAMKGLYAGLHIRPGDRADAILFKDQPPPDSLAFKVKMLAWTDDPIDQARMIVQHEIPYAIAIGAVTTPTLPLLMTLIDAMSPQELVNTIGSLKGRGAFGHPEVRALVDRKLHEAGTARRLSAMKVRVAARAAALDPETTRRLERVADVQVKGKRRIGRPTALLVDKSSSMAAAIEVGKRIAALLSAVTDAPLSVYAFDSVAYEVRANGKELSDWERAFADVRADGWTSIGSALEKLRVRRTAVEQIVVVTDEEENTAPFFADVYRAYCRELKIAPPVMIVKVGWASGQLERQLRGMGAEVETYTFTGDYYALPNLVPLLAHASRFELLTEIMETPLPTRTDGSYGSTA
jgi:hypothetical protein